MKKFLIVVGVIVGLAVLVGLGTWLGTGGAREQADRLVEAVRANDTPALGDLMSTELRAQATPEKLMHMTRTWGLGEATGVSWKKWETGTEGAKIEGSFTHPDGTSQELSMRFVRQGGAWKLNGIDSKIPGLITDPLALAVPDSKELEGMIAQVTREFGRGVRERNFTALYSLMSSGTRSVLPIEELDTNFAPFVQAQLDVSPATGLTPILHAPAGIDTQGRLVVEGHYPSTPVQTHFNYRFERENDAWRLVSLNISTVAAEPQTPSPPQ